VSLILIRLYVKLLANRFFHISDISLFIIRIEYVKKLVNYIGTHIISNIVVDDKGVQKDEVLSIVRF